MKQLVPDANVTKRWELRGEVGPFVAIGLPGRMLEVWEEEIRLVGSANMKPIDRLNRLLQTWGIPHRLSASDGLEADLLALCRRVYSSICQSKGGRRRSDIRQRFFKLHVKKNRLLSPHDNDDIHNELETLRDAHLSLQAHAEELLQDLQQQLQTQTEAAEAAADANHQLREHLNGLFVRESAFHGKQIQDCQERAARYKLSALKSRAQLALAVGRQIGLDVDVESLVVKDCTTGTLSQLPLSSDAARVGLSSSAPVYCSKTSDPQQDTPPTFRLDASSSQRTEPNERSRKFSELPVSEKAKIYRLLQILDRFYISDAAYHEVTMTFPDLPMPKSYLVKQSRAHLNNLTTPNTIDHGNGGRYKW